MRLLVDMMSDPNWCGAGEIFWSPTPAAVPFLQPYTLYNVGLHGWSPDGGWLLCSSWLDNVSAGDDCV